MAAVLCSTQTFSVSPQTQHLEPASTTVSPRLRELFRKADCASTQPLQDRYQAADVLHQCLENTVTMTDPLWRLLSELQSELSALNLQIERVEQRTTELENLGFSPTTKLRGVS